MRYNLTFAVAGGAALAMALAACGGDDAPAATSADPSKPAVVSVALADFTVTPSATSARSGAVTLQMHNEGKETHELLVVKTDLPAGQLPVDDLGDVSEDGEGLTFIDEREGIEPGSGDTLTVTLQPGRYVLLCNLPEHYKKGMVTTFDVTGDPVSEVSTTMAPEDVIVSAAEVAKGLKETVAAIERGAPTDELYNLWFTYEGTVRATDQATYLDLEDQLAALKHAELKDDAAAHDDAAARFAKLVDAYLSAHPG